MSQSKVCSVRRLVAALIIFAMNTPVVAKDGKELPIRGGKMRVITYVPGQNKLLMSSDPFWQADRGMYGAFTIVSASDGKVIGNREIKGRCPQFSPDAASLLTLSDKAQLWSTSTAKLRKEVAVLQFPCAAAFSTDGKILAIVGQIDQDADSRKPWTLTAVDLPSGKERWTVPLRKSAEPQLAVSKQDKLLVALNSGWRVVDLQTGIVDQSYDASGGIFGGGRFYLCQDSKRIVNADKFGLRVSDIESHKRLLSLPDKNQEMVSAFILGDDRRPDMVINGTSEGMVRMLDCNTLKVTEFGDKHQEAVTAIAASAAKRIAVTGSKDFRIKVWDLETSQVVETLVADKSPVRTVAISTDGERIAGCYENGSVRIWNLK